jgi:hypothetical protein
MGPKYSRKHTTILVCGFWGEQQSKVTKSDDPTATEHKLKFTNEIQQIRLFACLRTMTHVSVRRRLLCHVDNQGIYWIPLSFDTKTEFLLDCGEERRAGSIF